MTNHQVHLSIHGTFLQIVESNLFHVLMFPTTMLSSCLEGVNLSTLKIMIKIQQIHLELLLIQYPMILQDCCISQDRFLPIFHIFDCGLLFGIFSPGILQLQGDPFLAIVFLNSHQVPQRFGLKAVYLQSLLFSYKFIFVQ